MRTAGRVTSSHVAERLFVWAGGASFVASLAVTAWWYAIELGKSRPFHGWGSLGLNASLFAIFALHHSVFARPAIKTAMARVLPDRLLRSVYVWTASVLLVLLCLLWRPIGGVVYRVSGWPRTLNVLIQVIGLVLIARSVRAIDPLELAGIHPPHDGGDLQVAGPYRLVRHPLYLGWILVVFGSATMTIDRLAFAAVTAFYLIVAIAWEEHALLATFGEAYDRYRHRVRWRLIPYVF